MHPTLGSKGPRQPAMPKGQAKADPPPTPSLAGPGNRQLARAAKTRGASVGPKGIAGNSATAAIGNQLIQALRHSGQDETAPLQPNGGHHDRAKVHQGRAVESLLSDFRAPGATIGNRILLSGKLAPAERQRVLAHEMTHASQAGFRSAVSITGIGARESTDEREANIAAAIGTPMMARRRNADPNVIRLFDRNMLLQGSITKAWAEALNDEELVQASNALKAHMALLLTSSPDYEAAVANSKVLEDELEGRDLGKWYRDEAARTIARRPGGPPATFGIDNKTGAVYVSITPPGATLQEVATYVYGSAQVASELGEGNGLLAGTMLPAGTTVKLIAGRMTAPSSDALTVARKSGAIMRTDGIPETVEDNGLVYQFPGPEGVLQLNSGQFNAMLHGIRKRTQGQLQIHVDSIDFLRKLRNEHEEETNSLVRGISDWAGDVDMPGEMSYLVPAALGKSVLGQLEELEFDADPRVTARQLNILQKRAISVIESEARLEAGWENYIRGTISGAEITVNRLEIVRNVSFGIVAGMAGALAAPAAIAALGGAGITGAGATAISLGAAGTAGGVVRGGFEVALPGAQADVPVGERFSSGFKSGFVQGMTGGIGSFATPAVSNVVTGQLATRYGQTFVQSTAGRHLSQGITGTIVGAPTGAGATAAETLPSYLRGDISGSEYASGIGWSGLLGGGLGGASTALPISGISRSSGIPFKGTPITPKWALAGPYSPIAPIRGATTGFHNLPPEALPAFPDDPGVAGYSWARLRSPGGVDEWVPIRTYGPKQEFEVAWYADPANPNAGANFNLLYGPSGNPNALRLVGSRATQRARGGGYRGMAANDPYPGAPSSTRRDFPMATDDFEVTLPDGTTRRMIRGHNIDFFDTTERTTTIPDSNLDVSNFTPEPPEWGTLSGRNRLTMRMRTATTAGGTQYRQINIYGRNPATTASGKPVPESIYFIEVAPNGTASRAWRIPFDDPTAFQGINMNRAADIDLNFGVNPASVPNAVEINPTALPPSVLAAAQVPIIEEAQ